MSQAVPPEALKEQLLPALVTLGKDPIPNIRFNVAKSLETLAPILKPKQISTINDQVKPLLSKLKDDKDIDVRFFSEKALTAY